MNTIKIGRNEWEVNDEVYVFITGLRAEVEGLKEELRCERIFIKDRLSVPSVKETLAMQAVVDDAGYYLMVPMDSEDSVEALAKLCISYNKAPKKK